MILLALLLQIQMEDRVQVVTFADVVTLKSIKPHTVIIKYSLKMVFLGTCLSWSSAQNGAANRRPPAIPGN